jgi:cytochrome c556
MIMDLHAGPSGRRSRRAALAGAMLLLGAGGIACGQEQGVAPPKDTIFARKILMDTISSNMDEIETMTGSPAKIPLGEAHEHADVISVMLQAFPHLFPAATNQWKPNVERDAGTDTFASPDVWTRFPDFYKRAEGASKIALKASRTESESDFRALVTELRTACDSCHAAYQKPD